MRTRNQPEVSLNEMRTLIAAEETGTFTAAAKRLGVTQPAVSRQLMKLEARLGVTLFDRDARHLELTTMGEKFLAYARDTLGRFDNVMEEIRRESIGARGELRIGASTTLCDFLVLGWVREFGAENPDVAPHVFISDSDGVEEDLLEGGSELGFIGRSPASESLRCYPVADDEVVLAVPSTHRFAACGEIDLEDLAGQPFIIRDRASADVGTVVSTVASKLRQLGIEHPQRRVVMALNSAQACLNAVSHGFGMSWISYLPFSRGEVVGAAPVRIRGIRFDRKLYLVHPRRPLSPVARVFMAWLLERHQQTGELTQSSRELVKPNGYAF
jgi:DNA-binding transcriptional LysR family regulator